MVLKFSLTRWIRGDQCLANEIGAPIGEEDAASVIGTSLHGRYDIGLPGSGPRSTPRGLRLVAPCRWSSPINLRSRFFLPPRRVRGIWFAARTRYQGSCTAVSAPQFLDRTKFLLIVSDSAAVSAPSRRWWKGGAVGARGFGARNIALGDL